jgi:hypothetical protein
MTTMTLTINNANDDLDVDSEQVNQSNPNNAVTASSNKHQQHHEAIQTSIDLAYFATSPSVSASKAAHCHFKK